MGLFSAIGSIMNEMVKQGTGIDVGGMVSDVKASYDYAQAEYNDLIEYEEYYIAIYDYDGYQDLKRQVMDGLKSGVKQAILYNDSHYTVTKTKLMSMTDEQLGVVEKLYRNGKIPTNAKCAVIEELQCRGITIKRRGLV